MVRIVVFATDLGGIIARTESRAGIRWGEASDRHTLVAAGISEAWANWAMGNGAKFVIAEENGRIIGHNIYLTTGKVHQYDWLVVNQREGQDVFALGGFVVPERRGEGLLAAMKGFAARHFAAEGYRRYISTVDSRNAASLRAQDKVGSIAIATLTRVRVGKLILVWQGRALRCLRWGLVQPYVLTV